jgi:hypothetical protein
MVGGVWYGLDSQASYQQEARRLSVDYAKLAGDKVQQACLGSTTVERGKCIKETAAEYRLDVRDKQREYGELVAQKTSALWTSIMGIAALIGMALSAIGVALVYTTFAEARLTNRIAMKEASRATRRAITGGEETRRAMEIADKNAAAAAASVDQMRENSLTELRPWLTLDGYTPTLMWDNDNENILIGISFSFRFINAGRIPAVKVNILNRGVMRPSAEGGVPKIEVANEARNHSTIIGPNFFAHGMAINLAKDAYDELRAHHSTLFVHHLLTYSDPRNPETIYQTETLAKLTFVGDERQPDGSYMPRFQILHVGPQNRLS